ncbi:DUF4232 domain-containing protein [Kitasatospora sp. Root107]|uniref:DUF4232 domain-containing protein n=1 Tax=Kitasatospora sp. Root107 TaxID=1736424 RepID=UPI000709F8F4|nr:DUF4232 domain-containing protein [Kitasatospora sp. Root107]KQV13840.1 hypothetical protein ASC99_32870 [Kitasatospora sp. Root107]
MRSSFSALPVVLAGALLLAGCGSQAAGPGSRGGALSPEPLPGASSCGVVPSGGSAGPEKDGVKITAVRGACAEFEVTNREAGPLSYSISLTFMAASGGASVTAEEAVLSVGSGQTVKRTVVGPLALGSVPAGVRIVKVRSVPSAEASAETGPCPPSGVRVYADQGNAAMGLRAVGLHLENCGTGTTRLNGYPQLQILDEEHKVVESVQVLQGGSAIATGTGADGPPEPLALQPGERAQAIVVWRNTLEAGVADPVNAPYLRVRAQAGSDPVMVIPELDLGTTGRLGVGAWQREDRKG